MNLKHVTADTTTRIGAPVIPDNTDTATLIAWLARLEFVAMTAQSRAAFNLATHLQSAIAYMLLADKEAIEPEHIGRYFWRDEAKEVYEHFMAPLRQKRLDKRFNKLDEIPTVNHKGIHNTAKFLRYVKLGDTVLNSGGRWLTAYMRNNDVRALDITDLISSAVGREIFSVNTALEKFNTAFYDVMSSVFQCSNPYGRRDYTPHFAFFSAETGQAMTDHTVIVLKRVTASGAHVFVDASIDYRWLIRVATENAKRHTQQTFTNADIAETETAIVLGHNINEDGQMTTHPDFDVIKVAVWYMADYFQKPRKTTVYYTVS